jgi:hypothetical protein
MLHTIFTSRCTIESRTAFAFAPCFANKYLPQRGRCGYDTAKAAICATDLRIEARKAFVNGRRTAPQEA